MEPQKEAITYQYSSSLKQVSDLLKEEDDINREIRNDGRRSPLTTPQNSPKRTSPIASIKKQRSA